MVLTIVFVVILTSLTLLYYFLTRKYNYWNSKNVPHPEPAFLFGNFRDHFLQRKSMGEVAQAICDKFPEEPYVGAYFGTEPVLIVKDPEYIKLITTKDFTYFSSRELQDFSHKETFGKSLIMAHGEDWRFTRTNMAPMFTSAKLKNMFPLIEDCAADFGKYLKEIDGKPVEARKFMAFYTMSTFVSSAFGIDLKNFGEKHIFHEMGDMFFEVNWIRGILTNIRNMWPGVFYAMGLRNVPLDLTKFLQKILIGVFESRGYKPSTRKDFVDSLLALKESAEKNYDKFDIDYVVAQSLAIFVGGFETSAAALSFTLYELAKHPEKQAKVHKEIDEYLKKTEGRITFDCITELPYVLACMDEALRIYPVAGALTREVTADYTMPSGLHLDKGLRIQFPTYHLHQDSKYFPQPEEFRPERFYGEDKQEIVPYSYIPFGEGHRTCIGKRFARLQSLPGFITVLRNNKVVLADGMPTKITIEPRNFTTAAKDGIHLRFLPR